MLFALPAYVHELWAPVAHAVANGHLGHAAKMATDAGSGEGGSRLICVYTEDFSDKKDVKRVVEQLVKMKLVARKGKGNERDGRAKVGKAIYYKADCLTHLDIMGGNEWGLKPSLYSSDDVLGMEDG